MMLNNGMGWFRNSWLWCRSFREQVGKETSCCRICEIIANREDCIYEDSKLYVFRDQYPSAKGHILVVPKRHIPSVYSLLDMDLNEASDLLGRMIFQGQRALKSNQDCKSHKFGFHVPPFFSIPHLHMHVFELPYKSCIASLKYVSSTPYFVEAHALNHYLLNYNTNSQSRNAV